MTRLEKTITKILQERRAAIDEQETVKMAEAKEGELVQWYGAEFDGMYGELEGIEQLRAELIEWVNMHEIDDRDKRVVDGVGFYEHMLGQARKQFKGYREEGYESETAFDKATGDLSVWLEKPSGREGGGKIYVNYSGDFLARMRRLDRDW